MHVRGSRSPQTRHFILVAPSAQVKSALLFAGLYGGTPVTIAGDKGSRDHTERLLRAFGADVAGDRSRVELRSGVRTAVPIDVAGDFSAAAFFIVAATVAAGSDVTIESVGVNPTRTGLLDALHEMGAQIAVENRRERSGEPVADLHVRSAQLRGANVGAEIALRSIDEILVLAVAAAFARGETRITGVRELRAKESDRVAAIERMLKAAGIETEILPNGIAIAGGTPVANGAVVQTHHDHRTAMAVAALAAGAGELGIDSIESIDVSFPGFVTALEHLQA
jgi:3-phosphoshikimate 1-carboxyvinyltransferase